MAINLSKGSKINLKKEQPALKHAVVGLGWDANEGSSNYQFDLDASAFMLGENNKIPNELFFIFYNNMKSPDGAVIYSGDNRTGAGEGDDETIKIDLSKVDPSILQILFVVSIDQAEERKQNFGMVSNSFIRIYNEDTAEVLYTYMLQESFPNATAIIMGRLVKSENEWSFEAMGNGFDGGLQTLIDLYC